MVVSRRGRGIGQAGSHALVLTKRAELAVAGRPVAGLLCAHAMGLFYLQDFMNW